MPSKTKKQRSAMRAACRSAKVRRHMGISKKVACEFMRKDRGLRDLKLPPGKG